MSERIIIIGGPRTGKTTLARKLSPHARSTDDVMSLGWSEASEEVSHWFDERGPWVIEGVAAVRALRKWLARNPISHNAPRVLPCDRIIRTRTPFVRLTRGQLSMASGVESVWREITTDVYMRGVRVEDAP